MILLLIILQWKGGIFMKFIKNKTSFNTIEDIINACPVVCDCNFCSCNGSSDEAAVAIAERRCASYKIDLSATSAGSMKPLIKD